MISFVNVRTSWWTIMMVHRLSSARVVWHICSKERNLHFTIVMKTDPLLCFRLSFVVYFALWTIYLVFIYNLLTVYCTEYWTSNERDLERIVQSANTTKLSLKHPVGQFSLQCFFSRISFFAANMPNYTSSPYRSTTGSFHSRTVVTERTRSSLTEVLFWVWTRERSCSWTN